MRDCSSYGTRLTLLFFVSASLIAGPGCTNTTGLLPAPLASSLAPDRPLPLPTKDDVALVDGRPLSISAFLAIRSTLKDTSTEAVFWTGVAALAIQNDSLTRTGGRRELTPEAAIRIAQYATGEMPLASVENHLREYLGTLGSLPSQGEIKQQVDRLVTRAVVQRNPQVLMELH